MLRKIKIYLWLLGFLLAVSLTALLIALNSLNPEDPTNVFLFYLFILGTSFSLSALLGYWLRRRFGIREMTQKHFSVSIRQAIWFSILVSASLLLQSLRLFSVINSLLLVFALLFLEFYFLAKDRKTAYLNSKSEN